MDTTYKAPWGRTLQVVTILATALCLLAPYLAIHYGRPHRTPMPGYLTFLAPAVILVCALFAVRGYRIEAGVLLIRRLLWTTRVPLSGLLSVTVERNAMRGSLRTCGIGGLFSFTGWYWSRRLGSFRAFVTDLRRTVILQFPNRTIVVSPEEPERFAHEFSHCVIKS